MFRLVNMRAVTHNARARCFSGGAFDWYEPLQSVVINPTEVRRIKAYPRLEDGSRVSRKLRRVDLIPGILHGNNERGVEDRYLLTVEAKDLQRELDIHGRAFENTVYDLEFLDTVQRVLPRCLQWHPIKDKVISCNFLRMQGRKSIKVEIPLEFFNAEKCDGILRGGVLDVNARDIKCKVYGQTIPNKIRVNLQGLTIGKKIRVDEVGLPPEIVPKNPNLFLAKIVGRSKDFEDREEN